jgi:PKD repeat protein
MKISGSNILLAGITLLILLGSIASADDYCAPPPPGGVTSVIETSGTWTNITLYYTTCYDWQDAGDGIVTGTPCSMATFTANKTCTVLPDEWVQFNDTSTDTTITDYYWMFGDGNISVDKDPINEYNSTGMFTVNHSVTNPIRTMWENQSNYITVRGVGDTCFGGTGAGGGSVSVNGGSGGDMMWLVFGIVGGIIALLFIARR